MATTQDYIEYVCEQISGVGDVRYKKMFGEYMVYVNDKPVIIVCNNTAYVKELPEITNLMEVADKGVPYKGANEHYVLDIDNREVSRDIVLKLESITPLPKPKKKST